MPVADDAREVLESVIRGQLSAVARPGRGRTTHNEAVRRILAAADAYARTAADAVTDAEEARIEAAPKSAAATGPAAWTPGFVHFATEGGIACNNRAPIPASKITSDPRMVSCTVCRNSRKFKAVA